LAECLKTGKGALALLAEHRHSCTGGEQSASSSFQPGEEGSGAGESTGPTSQ